MQRTASSRQEWRLGATHHDPGLSRVLNRLLCPSGSATTLLPPSRILTLSQRRKCSVAGDTSLQLPEPLAVAAKQYVLEYFNTRRVDRSSSRPQLGSTSPRTFSECASRSPAPCRTVRLHKDDSAPRSCCRSPSPLPSRPQRRFRSRFSQRPTLTAHLSGNKGD